VILAVHLLMEWLGLKGTVIVGATLDVALGVVLLAATAGRHARLKALTWPAVAAVAGLAFMAATFDIDPRRTASGVFRSGTARIPPDDKLIFHRDGKTATVDVVEYKGARSIRTNGKVDAAISQGLAPTGDEYTMALLALLPLGHRPDAESAAVIGFGSGMSTATLLGSPRLKRGDTIEIELAMVEGAKLFRPFVEAAYTDPRSRIVIDDAKSYFARGGGRYDIIVSEPSNPWVSGVASLFSEEFYARLHAYMNDGGVLAQWLHTYEMDAPTLASILKAVSKTFPQFVVYSSIDTDIVLIARKGGPPGPFHGEVLGFPRLQPMLAKLKLTEPDVVRRRAIAHWSTLEPYFSSFGVAANSDYFPIVDQRASKTRFTRDRVTDLVDLQSAPVPILEMLDHGIVPPAVRRDVARVTVPEAAAAAAWVAHDLVMQPGPPASAMLSDPLEVSARLVRLWTTQCRSEMGFVHVFGHLLALAEAVNPNLHPDVAGALWRRVGDSPCAKALPAQERQWIELFAAVAARDADRMAAIAARILEAERHARGPAGEYALIAAVTAAIRRGDLAGANELLSQGTKSWLRPGQRASEMGYLYNLANPKRSPLSRGARRWRSSPGRSRGR